MGCSAWKSESTESKKACGLWTSLLWEERENRESLGVMHKSIESLGGGWAGVIPYLGRRGEPVPQTSINSACKQFYDVSEHEYHKPDAQCKCICIRNLLLRIPTSMVNQS